ncbi:MEDS domain-containing protein [Actinomadura sp. 9N407]|uniref:MEDS domain-containing protein n=1 Tax=Actinomadura sp. 9N407 TaxID=3375154 RepID=UPI0037ABFC87
MSHGSQGMSQDATVIAVGAMTFGDHLCLAYSGDEERDAVLASYVRGGLLSRHRFVHVTDLPVTDVPLTDLPATGLHSTGLHSTGPDAGDAGRDPAVEYPPALEAAAYLGHVVTAPLGRFLDPEAGRAALEEEVDAEIARALALGYEGVRFTCEMSYSWGGWPGTEPFAVYEDACRRVFERPGSRAMALCQYDGRWFGPEQLRHLDARHAGRVRVDDLYDDGVLRITPTYTPPGLRLTGAIDESTLPAVEWALLEVAGRGGHFCLDLAGLDFCDMAGLRALVGSGRGGDGLERQVIIRDPPGYLHLMMRIAGWDAPPPGVYLVREPS